MVKLFEVDNFDDLYNKTALQNKLKDEVLQVFNMIIQVNWSKALVKQFSCDRKGRFGGKKRNSK